jgi:protocatechuate 3,4-dioxygenase, alpha subunit
VTVVTPFQTVGPFFDFGLELDGGDVVASEAAHGRRIVIEGSIRDGAGDPVADAIVEVWQANAAGRYRHPADEREAPLDPACDGSGRVPTTGEGRFTFSTVMPGRVAGPDGRWQAPHVLVSVLARGILTRLATRIYFDGEPANADDPVLELVPEERRGTLIARLAAENRYVFDIVLQGPGETVFFDV